ncbi:preprotein translocase YidC [Pseudalgibacter alginicilyticus]|uniref:Preprotein translocase YidC n=1 Tax=Pseudalgibacter alginicilyticus TaxID=1736674 RepID=A0A0P0D0R6_9FLAO|nr:preprotein translocase YidC [Pseudalgibacter alginicilyticus]ALJ04421.1 preprotein translocase YidC [Pseudalgibacter alginicilyticus]
MKITVLLLSFFLFTSMVFAQNINQFDANGQRHGIWKKNFEGTDVLRYEGAFLHGKEIGLFKFYKNINKKAVLSATKLFNKDNNIAEVKFYSSSGKLITEGVMNGKMYVGTWKYYQKTSNKLLTLEYYNDSGKLDGERFVYYPNGKVAEKQHYVNGKLNGISQWYSDTNVVIKEFVYENDVLHGLSKVYNAKGELIVEGTYKQGKKNGIWQYYENGSLTEEVDFTPKSKLKK